jgi:hypothetical protein
LPIPAFVIKTAQHASRMSDADIDGVLGPKTIAAAREYDVECDDFTIPMAHADKLIVTVAQHAAGLTGSNLDGDCGPVTEQAVRAYAQTHGLEVETAASEKSRPASGTSRASGGWAAYQRIEDPGVYAKDGIDLLDGTVLSPSGGFSSIPNRKQRDDAFGAANTLKEDGMRKYLAKITGLPGRFNKGAGVLPQVHEKAVPHIKLAFQLMEQFGVVDEVYKIWFFNYRHQRHDVTRPLSLHAWGIACDINSKENFAWSPKDADKEIQPFTAEWYQKYPRGLTKTAVLCMKKAGFGWGGDWPTFRDPMHFELLSR